MLSISPFYRVFFTHSHTQSLFASMKVFSPQVASESDDDNPQCDKTKCCARCRQADRELVPSEHTMAAVTRTVTPRGNRPSLPSKKNDVSLSLAFILIFFYFLNCCGSLTKRPASLLCRFMTNLWSRPFSEASTNERANLYPDLMLSEHPPHCQSGPLFMLYVVRSQLHVEMRPRKQQGKY